MGGRGQAGGFRSSVIGGGNAMEVTNEKSRSSRSSSWRYTVLEASATGNSGELEISYPAVKSYSNPNTNTTVAHYSLKAGIFSKAGDRTLRSHNINWDKVKSVSGKTYDIGGFLREKGFRWNRDYKRWEKT